MPSEGPDLPLNLPLQDWKLKLLSEDPEFRPKSKPTESSLKPPSEDRELKPSLPVQDLLPKTQSEDPESKQTWLLKAP